MIARRKIDTAIATPALDFLRSVLLDPKAKHSDKMRAALALAPAEKMASTRTFEPVQKARAQQAASVPSDWDSLLPQ